MIKGEIIKGQIYFNAKDILLYFYEAKKDLTKASLMSLFVNEKRYNQGVFDALDRLINDFDSVIKQSEELTNEDREV